MKYQGLAQADIDAEAIAKIRIDRKAAILLSLADIDAKSARPLRSIISGTASDIDKAKLSDLDFQSKTLRSELLTL